MTIYSPNIIPPFTSDAVAKELMSELMSDNVNSTDFSRVHDVIIIFFIYHGVLSRNYSR